MSYQKLDFSYTAGHTMNTEPMSFPDFVGKGYFDFVKYLSEHKDVKVRNLRAETLLPGAPVPTDTCHWRIVVHIDKKGTITDIPMTG